MKRIAPVLLIAGLASSWMGCQSATDSNATTSPAVADPSTTSDYTLVTLKVPNMT